MHGLFSDPNNAFFESYIILARYVLARRVEQSKRFYDALRTPHFYAATLYLDYIGVTEFDQFFKRIIDACVLYLVFGKQRKPVIFPADFDWTNR